MKNLKTRYLLAFCLMGLMTSCLEEEYPDAIIGIWKPTMINGSTMIGCQAQNTVEFDGTDVEWISYDTVAGSCSVVSLETHPYTIDASLITVHSNPVEIDEILYLDHITLEIRRQDGTEYDTVTLARQ